MDDDVLTMVSYSVDNFIAEMLERTNLDIISLNAVIAARCTLAADYAGAGEEFRRFLTHIAAMPIKNNETIQ